MKVKDLLEIMVGGDPEARVVVTDHYGRPIDVDAGLFFFWTARHKTARTKKGDKFFEIPAVDIGPEPE